MERGLFSPSMFRFFYLAQQPTSRPGASSFTRFLDHTQRYTTVGRTSLDEWSTRRRDLYLTTHNTHTRQTSMLPVGFEPTISVGDRPQTHALDRAVTGTGLSGPYRRQIADIMEWPRTVVSSRSQYIVAAIAQQETLQVGNRVAAKCDRVCH